MIELLGYISAVVIGIALGLIGGGGSILTVPVLVYLLGIDAVLATAYSLFIVGASSMVGAFRFARAHLIDFRTAVVFGLPSIAAVYLTRKVLVPAIPDVIVQVGETAVTKSTMLMMLFAVLMVAASYSMIRPSKKKGKPTAVARPAWQFYALVLVEGAVVGTLTGLVGAGGGFLIIPALVLLAGLEMKKAIGTSLLIISAKSLIGFTGDLAHYTMDWPFLLSFTALAIVGIFIGSWLSHRIDGAKLKVGFGWFVLVMGVWMIYKELAQ